MEELEYRVVFKDGSYGRWHRRDAKEIGEVILARLGQLNEGNVACVEVRTLDVCTVCGAIPFAGGLCEYHYEETEQDLYEDEGLWPDFHDDHFLGSWREPYLD